MSRMRTNESKKLLLAAVAGMLAGGPLTGCEGAKPPPAAPVTPAPTPRAMEASPPLASSPATATAASGKEHSCAGKNACKGQGGCGSGDNGCAGKNSCKGKGGCSMAMGK